MLLERDDGERFKDDYNLIKQQTTIVMAVIKTE